MDWGSPETILAIIAVSYLGWIINNYVRAKHGYPLEDELGGVVEKSGDVEAVRKVELLTNENGQLKGQVTRLEERITVLERIATDKGRRLADEIDALD